MAHYYTEGAQRALRRAVELARAAGADQVEPCHLLMALLLDDSLATAILNKYAVSPDDVKALLPGTPPDGVASSSASVPVGSEVRVEPDKLHQPDYSEQMHQVLDVARHHSRHQLAKGEVGTEQLLLGLVTIESSARQLLEKFGLTAATLPEHLTEKPDRPGPPLAVDVQLRTERAERPEKTDLLRMLDAAANRAREGIRVAEDFARFTLNDVYLTSELKRLRHELTDALRCLPAEALLAARDTEQDVGTGVTTDQERQRTTPAELVRANFKRVQEALRTLEECAKRASELYDELSAGVLTNDLLQLSTRLKRLRYEAYTLEKAVLLTHRARQKLRDQRLYLLVTASACRAGLETVVKESLAAGVGLIQLREKQRSDRELLTLARQLRQWTRQAGALLVINDRPDIALLVDADGVHVGQDDLSVYEARRIVGPDRLVGVSTHSLQQAHRAVRDGADYIGVGPVFPSRTKQFDELAGLELVRQVAGEIGLPWFAIGGIDVENVERVQEAGATRVAVSSAVCQASSPRDAARRLLEKLERSPSREE